jgi:adenosylcobinamide-GDP ribazoletransferase
MKILRNMVMALSMYTKLPMPRVEWKKENMKYMLFFFPLAGVLVGTVIVGLWFLFDLLGMGILLKSALLAVIPLLLTGGIHMDGFMDTLDGLGSYGEKEKKLEIMKDPNTGAFAVIGYGIYLLVMFGIFTEVSDKTIVMVGIGYIYSRILSGLSVTMISCSKTSGLLYLFASTAQKEKVKIGLLIQGVLLEIFMLWFFFPQAVVLIIGASIVFIYYWWMSKKNFGGITGDVAGFFLQLVELVMAFCLVMGDKLWF